MEKASVHRPPSAVEDPSRRVAARGAGAPGIRLALGRLPFRWNAIWKGSDSRTHTGPVHVSMNDYLIRRVGDIPRVAREGMRLRRGWPQTDGALGLWFATRRLGRRQISVSVWRSPEDLRAFVRSPEHLRIMRENRNTGELFTTAWTSERLDRAVIWREAVDRLSGRIDGVPHH